MAHEPTFPHWLLSAVVIGFFGGAFALGIAGCATTQESDFFSPAEVGFICAFFGAFGGAILGFLVWVTAAVVVLIRRAAGRATARRASAA
jgi:membrane associated rhomboid family serine protease